MNGIFYKCFTSALVLFSSSFLLASSTSILVSSNNLNDSLKSLSISNTLKHPSCNNENDGAIEVFVSGGVAPYDYSWTPEAQNSAQLNNLLAGDYTVIVTDANGITGSKSITLVNPEKFVLSSYQSNVKCFGDANASATVQINNADLPGYTYKWLPYGGNKPTANGLKAGPFTVQVSNAKGCMQEKTLIITQPNKLSINVLDVKNATCNGLNNGEIEISGVNGVAPYSYSWSPSVSDSNIAVNLFAGKYTVSVIDSNACVASQTQDIIEPKALEIRTVKQNASCFGKKDGTAYVEVSEGTPGYTFQWTPNISDSNKISNVGVGKYIYTITEANNCVTDVEIFISQPSKFEVERNVKDVSCFGGFDGSASVKVSGATPPYFYSWSRNLEDTCVLSSLSAGLYSVRITDINECNPVIERFLINQPKPLKSEINISTCTEATVNGVTYKSSGQYIQYFSSSNGCDSTLSIKLKVEKSSTNNIYQSSCGSFILNGVEYDQSGMYTQLLANENGCDSIIKLDLVLLDENDLDYSVNIEGNAFFVNSNTKNGYQWYECSNGLQIIEGETNTTFVAKEPGSYLVAINGENCSAISECFEINNNDILNGERNRKANIYPNPTTGKVYINLSSAFKNTQLTIFDFYGKQLFSTKVGNLKNEFDLSTLKKGTYTLEINSNVGKQQQLLVIY